MHSLLCPHMTQTVKKLEWANTEWHYKLSCNQYMMHFLATRHVSESLDIVNICKCMQALTRMCTTVRLSLSFLCMWYPAVTLINTQFGCFEILTSLAPLLIQFPPTSSLFKYRSLAKECPWAYKSPKRGVSAFSSVPTFINHKRVPISCLQQIDALKANNWTVQQSCQQFWSQVKAAHNTPNSTMSL